MRFLHAADLHIDSPLLGLDRFEGAPIEEIRRAPRDAFRRLIDLARTSALRFMDRASQSVPFWRISPLGTRHRGRVS